MSDAGNHLEHRGDDSLFGMLFAVVSKHRASLDQVLGAYVIATLQLHGNNISAAAKALCIDRRTFYRWRKRGWRRRKQLTVP